MESRTRSPSRGSKDGHDAAGDNGIVLLPTDENFEDVPVAGPSRRPIRSTRASMPAYSRPLRRRRSETSMTAPSGNDDEPVAGPSRVRMDFVEIPCLPLEDLWKYQHVGVQRPTRASRKRVFAEQDEAAALHTSLNGSKRASRGTSSATPIILSDHEQDDYRAGSSSLAEQSSEDDIIDSDRSASTEGRRLRRRTRVAPRARRSRRLAGSDKSASPDTDEERVRTRAEMKGRAVRPTWRVDSPGSDESHISYEGEDEIDMFSDYEDNGEESDESDELQNGSPTPAISRRVLTRHHELCDKCNYPPADIVLHRARRKKGRKKVNDVYEGLGPMTEAELAEQMGGWLECERCSLSIHWKCVGENARQIVLDKYNDSHPDQPPRTTLAVDEMSMFTCLACAYTACFECGKIELPCVEPSDTGYESDGAERANGSQAEPIVIDDDDAPSEAVAGLPGSATANTVTSTARNAIASSAVDNRWPDLIKSKPSTLLLRCYRCQRAVHYEHLRSPFPPGRRYTTEEIADYYQGPPPEIAPPWWCHQCHDWQLHVDRVIAWRPYPTGSEEGPYQVGELPDYKVPLPREYLVKFTGQGFRHVTWVPHQWLAGSSPQKLRNFIVKGPHLDLVTDQTLAMADESHIAPTIQDVITASGNQTRKSEVENKWDGHGPPPDPNAAESLPKAWNTVDRVLDVFFYPGKKSARKGKTRRVIESSDEEDEDDQELGMGLRRDGHSPPESQMVPINDWEVMQGRKLGPDDVDEIIPQVSWVTVKWQELQYDQACGDTPPAPDSPLFRPYRDALKRYLFGRTVKILILNQQAARQRDREAEQYADPPTEQPSCVVGGELMPFQVEGFQWLVYKYFKRESCILADDMGLGKTIQVASFLGYLASDEHKIYPSLVVVPNSTITNWVREFEKWVPHVRVVPYYGESSSRKVILQYELYHTGHKNRAEGLKAHVVLTTYDTITNTNEFRTFSRIPRWEVLIVDEGQAVKNDKGLLIRRLKQLNTVHRVLLTGTPLNNNLRELFSLLNFLDPTAFPNLDALESRFEDLTEVNIKELHTMLMPYILRRLKGDVLKLPPKVEIIVPISMTPVQRTLYKALWKQHSETVTVVAKKRAKAKKLALLAAAASGKAGEDATAPADGTASKDDIVVHASEVTEVAEAEADEAPPAENDVLVEDVTMDEREAPASVQQASAPGTAHTPILAAAPTSTPAPAPAPTPAPENDDIMMQEAPPTDGTPILPKSTSETTSTPANSKAMTGNTRPIREGSDDAAVDELLTAS